MTQSLTWLRVSTMRHVGWLEFNRPPVNAFTREMVDETHDAIAAALGDPAVRVLVLASTLPRYFSAGADLHVFKDIGQDGMHLIDEIMAIYRQYPAFKTEVLVASVRHTQHVVQAAKLGAHVATVPPNVLRQLFKHVLTDNGLKAFLDDWAKTGQSIL